MRADLQRRRPDLRAAGRRAATPGRRALNGEIPSRAAASEDHGVPDATGRKPRVLIVAHDVHWGGGMERAFAELIARAHTSVDFHVVSMTLAPELRPYVTWRRIHAPMRPFPAKYLSFFALAWWYSRSVEADLVHTCGAIAPMRADVASVHFCHRGLLATGEGLVPREGSLSRRLNTALSRLVSLAAERWCYRPARVQRLACVSDGLASEVESAYPGVTVRITPNGVDSERFRHDPLARHDLRTAEDVSDDTVVALFVGGDWGRKGLDVVIESIAAAAPAAGPPLQLWVVGPGDIPRHSALASRLGVGDRVRFFGPRDDAERFYSAADLFVLPSRYETFSLVAHEAAAAGLPVAGTAVHGIAELVVAGAGIAVERTAPDVARGIAQLAADPALRERLGAAGRVYASTLSWPRMAESVLAVYSELMPSAAPTPAPPPIP